MIGSTRGLIPARDMERTAKWYSEKLGIEPAHSDETGVMFEFPDGSKFHVFPTGGNPGTGGHTQLLLFLDDIRTATRALRERGVEFLELNDDRFVTDSDSVADRGGFLQAWFTDPEGNIVALIQPV